MRREKERITRIKQKKNRRKTLADEWREIAGGGGAGDPAIRAEEAERKKTREIMRRR